MAGFTSTDQIIAASTAGQSRRIDWAKNMEPTTNTVANECYTLFRGNGNPPPDAIFNAGTNDLFQPVTETTASAGTIQHAGNVSPMYKFILGGSANTSAATVVPCTLALVDVIGFYRITTMATTSARNMTNNFAAFSVVTFANATNIITGSFINLFPYTRVRFSTTGATPAEITVGTDYYVIRLTDTTIKVATSYANAVAGTAVDFSDDGSGVNTLNTILPRYTNGAGVNAFFFNSNATSNGAGTPNLYFPSYTNAAQTASRATPLVYPVGKATDINSHILYTGATAAGKYNYAVPLQAGDTGIASIEQIRNDATYATGEYSVAMYKELLRVPLNVLGQSTLFNCVYDMPSLPRVYDGAALYWIVINGVATPANSAFSGHLDFVWN